MKGQGMVSLYSVITALDSSHNIMLQVKNRMYLNQKGFVIYYHNVRSKQSK